MNPGSASNFSHLQSHDGQLVRLGLLAERYFAEDPNTCLIKLRQLAEALAQLAASRVGLYADTAESQRDLLRRLRDHGILPREVADLFHEVRKAGNDANHNLAGDHRSALLALRPTWPKGRPPVSSPASAGRPLQSLRPLVAVSVMLHVADVRGARMVSARSPPRRTQAPDPLLSFDSHSRVITALPNIDHYGACSKSDRQKISALALPSSVIVAE